MNPAHWAIVVSVGLFAGIMACLDIGYRIGRRSEKHTESAHEGIGVIEAAIFALACCWDSPFPALHRVSTPSVN
jgi:hypothetical protein